MAHRPNGPAGGTADLVEIRETSSRSKRSSDGELPEGRVHETTGSFRKVSAHRIAWLMHNRSSTIPDRMEINQVDGDKQYNRPGNLELVTRRENVLHSHRELNPGMSDQRVNEERNGRAYRGSGDSDTDNRGKTGAWSQRAIAAMFAVKQTTVSNPIVSGKTWTHRL